MEEKYSRRLIMRIWIVCSLGLFIDGYDLYISSIAEPFITVFYHPTPFMIGLTQAIAPLGAAMGAIIFGRVSDMLGRKKLLIFNLLFFVIIAILSAFAWNTLSLCVFRFLIGFGVGADYPICAAYLAETTPKTKTSQLIAAAMFLNCLASPAGALVGWIAFKCDPTIEVWRWLFASCSIPAIVALLLRAKLPESFIWQAHQRFRSSQQKKSFMKEFKRIFSPELGKITCCLSISWFLLDVSYYGVGLFTPAVLQALHISSQSDLLNSAAHLLKNTLWVNLFVMLGAFVAIFSVEKIHAIQLQKIGFIFSFFGLLIVSFSHAAFNSANVMMVFSGFILFNFFVNVGPGMTTYLLPAKLYDTDIKATGHGFAAGLGKFGAFIGALFLPVLQAWVGIYVTVGMLSLTLLLGAVLTHSLSKHALDPDLKTEWIEAETLSFSTT